MRVDLGDNFTDDREVRTPSRRDLSGGSVFQKKF
jgi:hypothetical protein